MPLPKAVKVSGINYLIEEVNEISGDPLVYGVITYAKALIQIKEDLNNDKKQQTLIHEILHACFFESGCDQDEETIDRVSNVLHQVLIDNPSLLS